MALSVAGIAAAQNDPPGRVGRINFLSGTVSFQPGGVDDWTGARVNRPLTTGDRLWVDQDGRAELHVGSAALRLSSRTAFEFLNLDDENVQIRLSEGSLEVRVRALAENQTFEVDTPNLAFSLLRPGVYRVDANPDNETTIVTVRGGQGEVTGGGQAFQVKAREQARVTGDRTITYEVASAPSPDWFDGWCDTRDRREERSQSAQYVSRDMIGYEDLDDAGDWQPVAEYGRVWYPRTVAADWAPYHYGHWAWVEPWGWTWIDDAPWGFAPFHYGRWAYLNARWGWIPGPVAVRPVYAPALVAFVGGRNFSLSVGIGAGVAWFPLGPREAYVPAYRASPTYINRVNTNNTVINNTTIINNTTVNNVRYVNQTAPGGITAVSRDTFVGARSVAAASVRVRPEALSQAQVVRSAEVAPSQASVMGRSVGGQASARPPAAVMSRSVVAKATPPPAPVPFMQRQTALQQNPGVPAGISQEQRVRTDNPRAFIRQAPTVVPSNAGQPTPMSRPNNGGSRGGEPVNAGRPAQATPVPQVDRPTDAVPAERRGQQRFDQPQPRVEQPAVRPADPIPAERRVQPRAEQPVERPAVAPPVERRAPRVEQPVEHTVHPPEAPRVVEHPREPSPERRGQPPAAKAKEKEAPKKDEKKDERK